MADTSPNPDQEPIPDETLPVDFEVAATGSVRRERRMVLLLVLLVGVVIALVHLTPLSSLVDNAQAWKKALRSHGWWSHLGFFIISIAAVMMGVPRLTVCGAAGLLFGSVEGFLLSVTGTTLGSYGAFLGVRKGFRSEVASVIQRRPWLERMLRKPSLMTVFWVRQLALPGIVLNALLGLSGIRHRVFLGGTLLGYIPLNAAACFFGSALLKTDLATSLGQLMGALAAVNIGGWLVWRKVRSMRESHPSNGA